VENLSVGDTERQELRVLVEQIKSPSGCVLVLGPGVAVRADDPNRRPLDEVLAGELLDSLNESPGETPSRLRQATERYSQHYGRPGLEVAARDFYARETGSTTEFHRSLAQLPFKLCISTSPDDLMLKAFKSVGKHPQQGYYNFNLQGRRKKTVITTPAIEYPLVYHLFGYYEDAASLVLTEADLTDFLERVQKGDPPIPDEVRFILRDRLASFLFLGAGFQNWYWRMLVKVLGVYDHRDRAIAFEDLQFFELPESKDPKEFFEDRRIEFRRLRWEPFAEQLLQTYLKSLPPPQTEPASTPASLDVRAPEAFLSYASEDLETAEQLARQLEARGVKVWQDKQNLRAGQRWSQVLPSVIQKQVDYVIVVQTLSMTTAIVGAFHREIEAARERDDLMAEYEGQRLRFLVPVTVGPCQTLSSLKDMHAINIRTPDDVDSLVQSILQDWENREKLNALNPNGSGRVALSTVQKLPFPDHSESKQDDRPPVFDKWSTRSRYPGTRPFSDSPDDQARFFGREAEGEQLYLRVLSVSLLLQFASSGLGKTSLLLASLFPRLRRKPYLPVMVRLAAPKERLVDAVARSFEQACRAENLEFPEVRKDGLWELLSTTLVWRRNLLLTPVLVFDQFEEVFTLRDMAFRDELAKELGALTVGVPPERLRSEQPSAPAQLKVPPDVKIIISLREDYLGALEEFSSAIPNLFLERLRLEPLSKVAAREAIVKAAKLVAKQGEESFWAPPFELDESVLELMLQYLQGESGVIEPFTLQLLCRHAEAIAQSKARTSEGWVHLSLPDFNGGKDFEQVLKNFYQDALAKVEEKLGKSERSNAEELCEHGLLDREGRRLILEEGQIHDVFGVDAETLSILGQERVIRRELRLESTFYEISHDRIAESIYQYRRNRLPRKEQEQIRKLQEQKRGAVGRLLDLARPYWPSPIRPAPTAFEAPSPVPTKPEKPERRTLSVPPVFVSHVTEDHEKALKIVALLEGDRLPCWIAPRDIQGGDSFEEEIVNAIDNCLAVLLIFSDRCNRSEYIKKEIMVAGESNKKVIPIRIENCQPRGALKLRLIDLQYIDAFSGMESAAIQIVRTISKLMAPFPRTDLQRSVNNRHNGF
jgi:hypothetical protein